MECLRGRHPTKRMIPYNLEKLMVDLVKQWKEAARRDDLFDHMVPSDVRLLVKEIERLRKIEVAAQEFRQVTDRAWRNGDFSHVINNANQQALWRALDGSDCEADHD